VFRYSGVQVTQRVGGALGRSGRELTSMAHWSASSTIGYNSAVGMFLRVASSWLCSARFGVSDSLDRMGWMGRINRIKTGFREIRERCGVDVRAENACVQNIHPVHPPHPCHPVEKIPVLPGSQRRGLFSSPERECWASSTCRVLGLRYRVLGHLSGTASAFRSRWTPSVNFT
jgi:hypothetical protein